MCYGRLVGVPFRGDSGSYRFAPVFSEKLDVYVLEGIMGEIGLLLDRWDRKTGQTGWDGSGTEGLVLVGTGLGAPTLDIEVWRVEGSIWCQQFHQCYKGRGVFV